MAPRLPGLACLAAAALSLGGCWAFQWPDSAPALVGIELPPPASFPAGVNTPLAATGKFSDGTTRSLTDVRWESSNPAVANVSAEGVVSGLAAGSATIVATDAATSISGRTTVTVTAAQLLSIALAPGAPSVPLGVAARFTATGTYGDGTTHDLTASVVWSSSIPAIASFTATPGVASTAAVGTTSVLATHAQSGVSASATLVVTAARLVSLGVTPSSPSVPVGVSPQFRATGTYTDGTTQDLTRAVAWSSSSPAVASISTAAASAGLARALATGTTTIQAAQPGTDVSASTVLTVTAAELASIAVTPASSSVPLGLAVQLTATGTYTDGAKQDLTGAVTWSSSDGAVASVSNAPGTKGLASSAGVGTTVIEAAVPGTLVSGATTLAVTAARLASIAVTPASASVPAGRTRQFTAAGTYTDGTTQDLTGAVTWSSSNEAVASLSNAAGSKGLATGVSIGSVTVRAEAPGGGVAGTASATVTAAELVSISIAPADVALAPGESRQLGATGTFTDGSAQDLTARVTWGSSPPGVAEVSNASGSNGLLTGVAPGSTTVEALDPATQVAATVPVTVTAPAAPAAP